MKDKGIYPCEQSDFLQILKRDRRVKSKVKVKLVGKHQCLSPHLTPGPRSITKVAWTWMDNVHAMCVIPLSPGTCQFCRWKSEIACPRDYHQPKILEYPIPATPTPSTPSVTKPPHGDISVTKRGIIDQLVPKRPEKWSEIVKNGQNGQNCLKWSKMVKNVKTGQNGPKWSMMVKNGQYSDKYWKWSKMVKNGPNGQKWSKMIQNGINGQKWSNIVNMV